MRIGSESAESFTADEMTFGVEGVVDSRVGCAVTAREVSMK
jgi:hypothetical protein